jgi:diguanylate cyclase (GGDEF)-like protein/PAS domain S-box-containing protein
MKLLIIDDHPANLRLLRAQLEAEGHEVVEAPNGVEGLRLLRAGPFDGAVSDILMPEMDGYRFCMEVRRDAALRGLPVVLYTSTYNSPADRQLALKAGADAYISKPAPTAQVLNAIVQAAARKGPPVREPGSGETDVLKKYSEVLVRKLEDKNLDLEKSLGRLHLARDIDQAIIGGKSPAQVAEAVLPRLRELLGLPRLIVNLFDLDRGEAEWLAAIGRRRAHVGPGLRYPLGAVGDIEALKRGEIQHIDVAALTQRPEAEALLASGVRWFLVVPMIVGDELIGGLSFGGPSAEFPPATVEIARQAAAQLAIAIQQSRLDERARQSDAQYRLLFESAPVGVTLSTVDGKFISVNPAFARIFGYRSSEDAMRALNARAEPVYADPQAWHEYIRRLKRDGTVSNFETQFRRADGSFVWGSLNGRPVDGLDSGESLIVTMIADTTLRKEQERRIARLNRVKEMQSSINAAVFRLHERQALLDAVCRVAVDQGGLRAAWIVWHDEEAQQLAPIASAGHLDGFLKVLALSTEKTAGANAGFSLAVLRSGDAIATNDLRTAPNVAFRQEALDRGYMATMHLPLTAGQKAKGVLVLCAAEAEFFDAEEQKLLDELAADVSFALESLDKTERLDYLAYYDPLTALPNRALFHDRLSHSLRARGGDPTLIAVALLDLERFRRINETLGRQAGDELLREIGGRLHKQSDSVARLGADLFALILRGARSAAEVNRALEATIRAALADPVRLRGQELRASCRAGVALYPTDGADADTLLRNAEAALRRSKGVAERIVFYAAEMNAQVADALSIENKLRRAIDRREFVLHYQPKVLLKTGTIVSAEALIRWNDPEQGLVAPGRFIPVLEETGLISSVGRWALDQTFSDLRVWREQGRRPPRIAVNVSAVQLQSRDFVEQVIEAIEQGGDLADLLELEITESLVMRNVEDSTRKLSILRGMGVTVAIDDFGTGYSSLSYLSRLPVDYLKIDRSFIQGVNARGDSETLVKTIIALAHGLGLKVVAEGVETEEQAAKLRDLGCDQAQGYLYSRPVPAAEFGRLLEARA